MDKRQFYSGVYGTFRTKGENKRIRKSRLVTNLNYKNLFHNTDKIEQKLFRHQHRIIMPPKHFNLMITSYELNEHRNLLYTRRLRGNILHDTPFISYYVTLNRPASIYVYPDGEDVKSRSLWSSDPGFQCLAEAVLWLKSYRPTSAAKLLTVILDGCLFLEVSYSR